MEKSEDDSSLKSSPLSSVSTVQSPLTTFADTVVQTAPIQPVVTVVAIEEFGFHGARMFSPMSQVQMARQLFGRLPADAMEQTSMFSGEPSTGAWLSSEAEPFAFNNASSTGTDLSMFPSSTERATSYEQVDEQYSAPYAAAVNPLQHAVTTDVGVAYGFPSTCSNVPDYSYFTAECSEVRRQPRVTRAFSSPEIETRHPRIVSPHIHPEEAYLSQSLPCFRSSASETGEMFVSSCWQQHGASPMSPSSSCLSPTLHSNPFFGDSSSGQPSVAAPRGMSPALSRNVCAVCGDHANCQHYGVRTCEGCKGFFKRTVQKSAKYLCLGNRDCVIDKRRRNRCQYCRFQKCLAVGMVKEVVRMDSLKGRRGRLPSRSKTGDDSSSTSLTSALVEAFTCPFAPTPQLTTGGGGGGPFHSSGDSSLLDSVNASLVFIRQWADCLPNWNTVVPEDREKLLSIASLNIMNLRIAYKSVECSEENDRGSLMFEDGSVRRTDCCYAEYWQPWLRAVSSLSVAFRERIDLDLTAASCLSALALLMTGSVDLVCPEKVDNLKNGAINCLKVHCTHAHVAKHKPQYFARVFSVLRDLHAISVKFICGCQISKAAGTKLPAPVERACATLPACEQYSCQQSEAGSSSAAEP